MNNFKKATLNMSDIIPKTCKYCARGFSFKVLVKAHEAKCKFAPQWRADGQNRDQSAVASFIDDLWKYDIDERATGFVVVSVTRDEHHPALRRKPTIEREDASEPFATINEAEAFIAKHQARTRLSLAPVREKK